MAAFNLQALRRLYNPQNVGRGTAGQSHRHSMHTTITYNTYLALGNVVPVQKGGYGSPVFELGIRLLLALMGSLNPTVVAEELFYATLGHRMAVVAMLREIADAVETYKPPE